jgi:rhamnose utilization protein RhaD (predicted bifunctional aldolase and dehydrogenase)
MSGRVRRKLVMLSRELGDPRNDYAILAEGNTSARVDDKCFLLKASGSSLRLALAGSFVAVSFDAMQQMLESPPANDEALTQALMGCLAQDSTLRPSTEAPLHALGLTLGGARWIGHTHPPAVNAILCSNWAESIVEGALFPDQIVVCGPHPLFVRYVDPGIPLALAFRDRLLEHRERYGAMPKTVYLQNHGLIALGDSPGEVLRIHAMAVKAARILLGAVAVGGPSFLPAHAADRIETRQDEQYRRAVLAGGAR